MTWVIAADHGGFALKEQLKPYLQSQVGEVADIGCFNETAVDYPDVADNLANEILSGKAEYGVLICGTGIGVSIRANRHNGIRAALVHSKEEAALAKQHNNANVLCFGGRVLNAKQAQQCIDAFIKTEFEGGRHAARVAKLDK